MVSRYKADRLLEDLSSEKRAILGEFEALLEKIKESSAKADLSGDFPQEGMALLKEKGLSTLMVPKEYGGRGGDLRDLTLACYTLGRVCPSLALCFFFHCSASSRGLLGLLANEKGLFSGEEKDKVADFSRKILNLMGHEKKWFANFASESIKSEKAMVTVGTIAKKTARGYELTGTKAFGCSTGTADYYLVTAALEGTKDASGLATFLLERDQKGITERPPWDALGMRATATHGIHLDKVFVPFENALAIKGAFSRKMQVSRGSFVGNQMAATAVYLGAAAQLYSDTLETLKSRRFHDTGRSIAESAMHKELIGKMTVQLETAHLWLARQLLLETKEPPPFEKEEVICQWRLCKGVVADAAFSVAVDALKACGTSGTQSDTPQARGLRNLAMGLVQAFPSERGRLEAASMIVTQKATSGFGGA